MTGGEEEHEDDPIIEMENVRLVKKDRERVFELVIPSFELYPGDMCLLRGESGVGKSTALELLALARSPSAASRFTLRPTASRAPGKPGRSVSDIDVMGLWERRRTETLARLRGRVFGYVPQTGGLLPFISVAENIVLPSRFSSAGGEPTIEPICDSLRIGHLLHAFPAALSVGQRQRVAVARAFAGDPAIIVADEPTASLDPANAEAIMAMLTEAAIRHGVALVIASHDQSCLPGDACLRRYGFDFNDLGGGHFLSRLVPLGEGAP